MILLFYDNFLTEDFLLGYFSDIGSFKYSITAFPIILAAEPSFLLLDLLELLFLVLKSY